jgi:ubiquitin carboxyl-terminal hydrolase 8
MDIPVVNINNRSKDTHGLCGIVNMGNTCYFNAAIHCLSNTFAFRDYFINRKYMDNLIKNLPKIHNNENIQFSNLNESEKNYYINNTISQQLSRMLAGLWTVNNIIQPVSFRDFFTKKKDVFRNLNQHDSLELLEFILDTIQTELSLPLDINFKITDKNLLKLLNMRCDLIKNLKDESLTDNDRKIYIDQYNEYKSNHPIEATYLKYYKTWRDFLKKNNSMVTTLFYGMLHFVTKCPNESCRYKSDKFDPTMHLSVPLVRKEKSNLMDSLDDFFSTEVLDNDNKWKCAECKNYVNATKVGSLWDLPIVLIIQFKRFGNNGKKNHMEVTFPIKNLSLEKYVSKINNINISCYEYDLYAIINHTGTFNSGHYFSYCENNGKWYNFDDEKVMPMSELNLITNNAYILFYIRRDYTNQPNQLNSINK